MPMQANLGASTMPASPTRHSTGSGDALSKPSSMPPAAAVWHVQPPESGKNAQACVDAHLATAASYEVAYGGHSSPKHWTNLGHALQEAGRYGEARTAFRQALRSAPQDSDAALGLADMEMECGRYQHAYDMFRIVLDKSPEHIIVRIHAARACYELGKKKRAKSLVEGWPQWTLDNDIAAELAEVLILIGKVRAGLTLLKAAPDWSRIGAHSLARLSSALAQSGRLKKARHCLALLPSPEAVRSPALREEILAACARLALQAGNLSGARRFLEFLDTPPAPGICRGAKLYFLLAEICYHLLDMEAAKSALVTGRCIQMKAADIASPLMVEFSSFP